MIKVFEPCITKEDLAIASGKCLATGQFDPGQYVDQFEAEIAKYLGVPREWVMVTSSCTAALATCYHFLLKGGRLQAPVMTWPGTYCTVPDVEWYDYEPLDNKRPAVIVDLYGTGRFPYTGRPLIIDAAHNFSGFRAGDVYKGHAAAVCYSFGPTKQLTTIRGGAVVSPMVNQNWRNFIHYGAEGRVSKEPAGHNYTMPDFNACIGLEQLKRFNDMQKRRVEILDAYKKALRLRVDPESFNGSGHIASLLVRWAGQRQRVVEALKESCIQTSHHYPLPQWFWGYYERSRDLASRQVTLPLHLDLTDEDVTMICDIVKGVLS